MSSVNNLSSDISVLIQEFYERKSLKERMFRSGILKYAKKAEIPKNNSKLAHFHKWSKFAKAKFVAENADPAAGVAASASEVVTEVNEYASYIDIPNFGDVQRIDSLVKESYPKFVEQSERTANYYLMACLDGGSVGLAAALLADGSITASSSTSFSALPAMYANGKANFAALGAGDQIKNTDIQRACARLEQQGTPKINGSYVCLLSPWAKWDLLTNDADFRSFFKLNFSLMQKGELAEWAGALIGFQDEPWRETLGGTEGTYVAGGDVVTSYVFGSDAFAVTQIMGKTGWKPRFKVQDVSKTGSVTSIGYRQPFTGIVLDTTFGVRLKGVAGDSTIANVA